MKRVFPLRTFATLTFVAIAAAGCGEEKKDTLKEVIDVEGTCAENHVGKQDHYAGQIVLWQSADTGEVNAYGFVTKPYSSEAILDEMNHPTVYHTPQTMEFWKVDIDTSLPNWVLHGVSDRWEIGHPYDSTCMLTVLKRGAWRYAICPPLRFPKSQMRRGNVEVRRVSPLR